jgi:anti-anti-sigma factor
MSFHFCTHSWEVRDIDGGTLVKLSNRDLDDATLPVLVDDLLGLVLESGQPNLYLDFSNIRMFASVVIGILVTLNTKLREHGGKLIMVNLNPHLYDICKSIRLTELLDIRQEFAVESAV